MMNPNISEKYAIKTISDLSEAIQKGGDIKEIWRTLLSRRDAGNELCGGKERGKDL